MIINDNILALMIAKDMASKKVEYYLLKDEVVTNPKTIKVGANEVVYVCYCYARLTTPRQFSIRVSSGTDVVDYHRENTVKEELSAETIHYSSRITTHWSNINIEAEQTDDYYIRYIRITIKKTN